MLQGLGEPPCLHESKVISTAHLGGSLSHSYTAFYQKQMGHSASSILFRDKGQVLFSDLFSESGLGEIDSEIQAEGFSGVLHNQKNS